jgi:hypothetical protein
VVSAGRVPLRMGAATEGLLLQSAAAIKSTTTTLIRVGLRIAHLCLLSVLSRQVSVRENRVCLCTSMDTSSRTCERPARPPTVLNHLDALLGQVAAAAPLASAAH